MSRVGKSKLHIPENIVLTEEANGSVVIANKGSGEKIIYPIPPVFKVVVDDKGYVALSSQSDVHVRQWGTAVRNLFQAILGISKPFERELKFVGVGYKATLQGNQLVMDLGYSHKVNYDMPKDVTVQVLKPTVLKFSSISKQRLGQVCAEIAKFRKPEPYKGKGIIKDGQFVYRKEGKKK